jgi:hypothetical protein
VTSDEGRGICWLHKGKAEQMSRVFMLKFEIRSPKQYQNPNVSNSKLPGLRPRPNLFWF